MATSLIPPPPLAGSGGGIGNDSDPSTNSQQTFFQQQPSSTTATINQPTTHNTTIINSTPYLQQQLTQLKAHSQNLSTELTKKLATSRSGQSLLHIGPSLSTLPPDLSSLLEALSPLLKDVSQYETDNRIELEKLVKQGRVVQCTVQKQAYAVECANIYSELVSAEEILRVDAERRMGEEYHGLGSSGKSKKNERREEEKRGSEDDLLDLSDDEDEDDEDEELDHASSLERAAYTTLHLLQELQSSSAEVSAITMNTPKKPDNSDTGSNSNPNILPSLNETSSSGGVNNVIMEKSRFLMKLSPRIRRLESDTAKCLVGRLESLLIKVRTLIEEEQRQANNNDSDGVGGDTNQQQQQQKKEYYIHRHSSLLLTIGHTLRGLALLGKGNDAQTTFARVAIMPIIRSKLSMGKLDEGGSRGECAGLFFLLGDIANSVKEMYGDLLRFSEGMFMMDGKNTPMEVDLVTCGVWVPVATALMADPGIKMAIFSPGIANVLQANYSALDTFLSELANNLLTPPIHSSSSSEKEEKADESTVHELGDFSHLYYQPKLTASSIERSQSRLYAHPTTIDYYKRWNLPIYYQLRFAEFTKRLDKALQRVTSEGWQADVFSGSAEDANKIRDSLGLELPIFVELYDVLLSMWKSNVFLRPLSHRFLRGAVQLVGRMLAFVRGGLEGEIEFGGSSSTDSSGSSGSVKKIGSSDEQDDSGASSAVLDTIVDVPSFFWNERVDDIAVVAWELTILDTTMTHDYMESVANTVCPLDEESRESTHNSSTELDEIKLLASDILMESSRSISPLVSHSWNTLIVDNLTSHCCTPLSAVKGVAATYRMTNRPPPTQASPFVATILRPLQEFDAAYASRTPPQIGDDWKRTVIASVSEKYGVAVEELIATVKRTEEALKSRKTRKMLVGGMSDGEKVKLQLFLDHREFKKQVESLLGDVENESIAGLNKLGELTQEAEDLFLRTLNK